MAGEIKCPQCGTVMKDSGEYKSEQCPSCGVFVKANAKPPWWER